MIEYVSGESVSAFLLGRADEPKFTMPVRFGAKDHWLIIKPTTEWQTMKTPLKKDEFAVATDLYFVDVSKL